MLLTLQPRQSGGGDVNEYTVIHKIHPTPRSSWSDSSSGQDPLSMESSQREHPPSTLTLPSAMPTPLPPPPSQWQGTEPMQQWLLAKTEEDRRSQEEEKTRQETLRLEQRRIEQMILIESLRAGVPPPMVPLIFAAMHSSGAGNLQLMIDTAHQWMAQSSRTALAPGVPQPAYQVHNIPTTLPPIQSQQLPGQVAAGEPQRDPRTPASNVYTPQHPAIGIINTAPQPAGNGSSMSSAAGTPVPLPAHLPRPIEIQQPVMQTAHVGPVQYVTVPHIPQHAPMRQEPRPRRPSPSISFHHWVPPGQPSHAPPSIRSQPEPTIPSDPAPPAMRSDIPSQVSPSRKRKSQAAHAPIAPPAGPSEFVPTESQSGHQSPIIGTPQHTPGTPSRTTVHESYRQEERQEIQRESPELSPRTRRGRSGRGFKREYSRGPEQGRKAQYPSSSRHQHQRQPRASDVENISDPSPDTGGST
ncbi:hypothetical protein N7488_003145 [Penicillium malachiteum]|nr:hypothetical protein N7488_003145 [Penicillium malachiteum]